VKKKESFLSNLFTVSFATIIAQLIPIFLQTLLRRLYSPGEFGIYGVYTSIIGITTIFYSLRYEQTINIPKNPIVALNLFVLSIIFSLFFTLVLFLTVFFFNYHILNILNISHENNLFLYLIPISSLFYAIFNAIYFLLIRNKEFRIAALNKIYRRGGEGISSISLGYIGNHNGLLIGDLIGNFINVISGSVKLFKIGINLNWISKKKLLYAFRRFKDMPKFNTIPALLNSLCLFLPNIYINKFYSTEVSGVFNLTFMVLNIPIVFFGKSVSDVFIQRFSEKKNDKKSVMSDFYRVTKFLVILSVIMVLTIVLFGPTLFSIIFGKQWELSGEFSVIFVWLAAIRLIVSPFNIVFVVFEKVKVFAKWQLTFFLATVSFSFFGFLDVKSFLILIVVVNSIFYIINYFMTVAILKKYEWNISTKI